VAGDIKEAGEMPKLPHRRRRGLQRLEAVRYASDKHLGGPQARTPADNATIDSFFATLKNERLYHGAYSNPIELISDADGFVIYYNENRLHRGIGSVTPAEKHDGPADKIIAACGAGMKRARQQRLQINRGCSEGSDAADSLPIGSKALTEAASLPPSLCHPP
jgi:hypothetical protein